MNMSPRAAAASAFWEWKPWMCSTSAALRDRPVSITSGIVADAARHNGANGDAGLDDRVQTILPVANAALVV
jgi:hypothetical protein